MNHVSPSTSTFPASASSSFAFVRKCPSPPLLQEQGEVLWQANIVKLSQQCAIEIESAVAV
eukprot:CAMPEP_0118968674 /NCGR_PEP_ID=MMETSP1173-20130426/5879_1 /TAXON_ID=1034831 /ORGANISM="Rhizochromulina marina cf, Strain CCMP1243" /LENGTH=60 /DNA_ID=CAMNT_0006917817 /DNA_START=18 /DNA_END=196 /DNA_ORIENTATION=+